MNLVTNYQGALGPIFVFIIGVCVVLFCSNLLRIKPSRSMFIYVWHSVFSLVYLVYVLKYGGDAISYYEDSKNGVDELNFGSRFVEYMVFYLVIVFGKSILAISLFFNVIGTIGLIAFDASLQVAIKDGSFLLKRIVNLLVLLPSLNFWSSGIGKDSISFMATGVALWSVVSVNRRWFLLLIAIAVMFLVRPHIGAIMIFAWLATTLIQYSISFWKKVFILTLLLALAYITTPLVFDYVGDGNFENAKSVEDYIVQRQTYNLDGGGGVDISAMILPVKMLSYLFRPIIFETSSLTSFAAGLDNLVLSLICLFGVFSATQKRKQLITGSSMFISLYSLLAWLVLSTTTANIGIALRQKWMFTPMVLFLMISFIASSYRNVRTAHNLKLGYKSSPVKVTARPYLHLPAKFKR